MKTPSAPKMKSSLILLGIMIGVGFGTSSYAACSSESAKIQTEQQIKGSGFAYVDLQLIEHSDLSGAEVVFTFKVLAATDTPTPAAAAVEMLGYARYDESCTLVDSLIAVGEEAAATTSPTPAPTPTHS
jgi:hypothetical protein